MDLNAWLNLKKMTIANFAKEVEVSVSCIKNYLNGRRAPNLSIAAKIEVVTEGKVTVHDLMEWWKKKNS